MKRMLPYIIAALLTFFAGVSADAVFNYDYYQAKTRYLEYRRTHPHHFNASAVMDYVKPDNIGIPVCFCLAAAEDIGKVKRDITRYAPACNVRLYSSSKKLRTWLE